MKLEEPEMNEVTPRRRRLGRTDLMVSEIGLGGAWVLGRDGNLPLDHGVGLVREALASGINYLDTAECYIGGKSEEVFGIALESWSEPVVLATKFGHRPVDFSFSRESVLESVAESRRLLGGRTIDILQIHTPAEPTWEALFGRGGAIEGMQEARERGWCRWFGITGREVPFLLRCVKTDLFDTLLVFLRYDLIDQTGEALLAEAASRNIGVIAASPLRMGMLGSARLVMTNRASDVEQARLRALDRLVGAGCIPETAYRFILTNPLVNVMLAGVTERNDLASVLSATQKGPLSNELVAAIYDLGRSLPGETPL